MSATLEVSLVSLPDRATYWKDTVIHEEATTMRATTRELGAELTKGLNRVRDKLAAIVVEKLEKLEGLPEPVFARWEGTLYARRCWWILNPAWGELPGESLPTLLLAKLYRRDPDSGAAPAEVVEVARRDG